MRPIQPSKEVFEMIISLTGPSGVGKGHIKKHLLTNTPNLNEIIWSTTRSLRPDEISLQSNREHLTNVEFNLLVAQGKMIFSQELFGHMYGLRVDKNTYEDQTLWITEFHIDNVIFAKKTDINLIAIAIIPHNISLLKKRLILRSTENHGEIADRLLAARSEIAKIESNAHCFDFVFTVCEENQHQISDIVFESLTRHLQTERR